MIIKSLQISGTSGVVSLASSSAKAKWIQFTAPSTNSDPVLIGGAEVTNSVGFPLDPGAGQFLPPANDIYEFYPFNKTYVYVESGDVLNILYAVDGSNT